MYVLVFIKCRADPERVGVASDITYRRFRAFLHNISERARQFDLAGSFHDVDFKRHDLSADGGERETRYHSDPVFVGYPVLDHLSRSEELGNVVFVYNNFFQLCSSRIEFVITRIFATFTIFPILAIEAKLYTDYLIDLRIMPHFKTCILPIETKP